MPLDYGSVESVVARLITAHDPQIAKIRGEFFRAENAFFKEHIRDQRVLVAGAGLGHDSFELAEYNNSVVGVEFLEALYKKAEQRRREKGTDNIEFVLGDFTHLCYPDKSFDSAVINMGTTGDFTNTTEVIREPLRVADVLYLDFYPPTHEALQIRKRMYTEEGWKEVRIDGTTLVSADGLYSTSLSRDDLENVAYSLGTGIKFHQLCAFAEMAEISE